MAIELTLEEAAAVAEDACLSLTEVQQRLIDALENSSDFMGLLEVDPEAVDAIIQTQLNTLDRIQYEICPRLIAEIRAGAPEKLGNVQRLIRSASQASLDMAQEYNTFFTLPGAVGYITSNSFKVAGTYLQETTNGLAGVAAGIGLLAVVMLISK